MLPRLILVNILECPLRNQKENLSSIETPQPQFLGYCYLKMRQLTH